MKSATAQASQQTLHLGGHDVSIQIENRGSGANLTFTAGEYPTPGYLGLLGRAVLAWRKIVQMDGSLVSLRINGRAVNVGISYSSPERLRLHLSELGEQMARVWPTEKNAPAAAESRAVAVGMDSS